MISYHHDGTYLVIIPTYNEKENITLLLNNIFENYTTAHVLIVDDASPDSTGKDVAELQTTYKNRLHLINRPQKMGLGTAYITGFEFALAANYQYIITMDADFSHPIDKIQALYETCRKEGYDIAIGSRYIMGVNVVNWPMGRILLSYSANWLARLITGLPVMDVTAGFQCYKRVVLETIDLQIISSVGYSFQVEMKFIAWKYGFKLKEVPIIFMNRLRGYSKMSHHIIFEAFVKIIKLKIVSLFKKFHRSVA
jgi:dolichol-phosphate mannosyltransferase